MLLFFWWISSVILHLSHWLQARKVGSRCCTQTVLYLHTVMNRHTQAWRLAVHPPLTSTQTHRGFQLCFSQENSLSVLVLLVFSRDVLMEWKPDSLSVNPLPVITPWQWEALEKHSHRWRVVDLLTGVSHGAGEGWGVGVIYSSFHAAPVKDYYPRCISTTTTLINPILLLLTSLTSLMHPLLQCRALHMWLCFCTFRKMTMSPWESFLRFILVFNRIII